MIGFTNPKICVWHFTKQQRGRRSQTVVKQFADGLDNRIRELSKEIREGTIQVGRFQQFLIRDPKERVITAPCFDERVLHHAIMNLCEPVLDRWLIDDTFACRNGKGREAAVLRAQHFSRNATWCLKLDVRKHFDSVPHQKLLQLLDKRFKDKRLLQLLERIVVAYRGEIGVGLPIGSLTSQHFANFYLGWMDRFVKETLRVRGYVRYMDDMVLWDSGPELLVEIHHQCQQFAQVRLGLSFKPSRVQRTAVGVFFLGCRVWPTHVELNARSKRRWRRRVRVLERAERLGLISESDLQQRLVALTAFAKAAGAKSWRFRSSMLQQSVVNDPKRL